MLPCDTSCWVYGVIEGPERRNLVKVAFYQTMKLKLR